MIPTLVMNSETSVAQTLVMNVDSGTSVAQTTVAQNFREDFWKNNRIIVAQIEGCHYKNTYKLVVKPSSQ